LNPPSPHSPKEPTTENPRRTVLLLCHKHDSLTTGLAVIVVVIVVVVVVAAETTPLPPNTRTHLAIEAILPLILFFFLGCVGNNRTQLFYRIRVFPRGSLKVKEKKRKQKKHPEASLRSN
jgi:hypothetical protein